MASAMPGVVLLSSLVLNGTSITLTNVVDQNADFTHFVYFGLPFLLVWVTGIAFAAYYTDDDGYVTGPRRIESEYPIYRVCYSACSYLIEGVQLTACSFGYDAVRALKYGRSTRDVLGYWLLQGLGFYNTFIGVVVVQVIMIILTLVPIVLWRTLERDTYARFAQYYVYGPFGRFISLMQDCYVFFLTLPCFIILLTPAVCTYYTSGEDATAIDGDYECGGAGHITFTVIGASCALIAFGLGVMSGTVPALVERNTDIALNGRYTAVSFAVKCAIAATYVMWQERHPYFHVLPTLLFQACLVFLNVTLRPCLIERVNFHRSAAFILAMIPSTMVIVSTGLNDELNPLPVIAGSIAFGVGAIMLLVKYFTLPCGKLFPAMRFMGGMYEGGICLGLSMPHGKGIIKWEEESKTFAGSFFFGHFHGYGVFTQFKYFFQGIHRLGRREGFGVTNMMEDEAEETFEGSYRDDVYNGPGTKTFRDADVYEGNFEGGLEHGPGVWSYATVLGRHKVQGAFEDGVFTNFRLQENEVYDGDLRYGVPHGIGRMVIEDDIFEGEWRAGKLHGNGTVEIEAGEYDGLFREGLFSDKGTWRDEHETYTGEWKDGFKHGQGVQELESGSYEGQFAEGNRHGYGTFTYNDGTVYQGSWQHNAYHGTGLLQTSDGAEYDGNWNRGHRHGTRGCVTLPDGETYLGGWENDEYHGQGILKLPDLGEYNGKFEFGKRHFLGRFTFYDGSEYVGEWNNDFAHGDGHFVFASRKAVFALQVMTIEDAALLQAAERCFLDYGGVYDGAFEDGAMHGHGKVTTGDGTFYEGEWFEGLPHGEGMLRLPDGSEYEGEFLDGVRDGVGTMVYPDKRMYRGSWELGKRNGHGALFSGQGEILHECEWENDVPGDAKEETREAFDIPTVDVDELLRDILPAQQSKEEVDESRARRRLELEELHERGVVRLLVEEGTAMRRHLKILMLSLERTPRRAVEREEEEAMHALEKPLLGRLLTIWKKEFEQTYERPPKKSDMVYDEHIAPLYRYYTEVVKKRG